MSLPSNVLILVWKLRENHLPGDGDKNTCVKKEYVGVTYGAVQYWAPVGVSGVRKIHLTCLKEQPNISDQWAALFGGKRCVWSSQHKRFR